MNMNFRDMSYSTATVEHETTGRRVILWLSAKRRIEAFARKIAGHPPC